MHNNYEAATIPSWTFEIDNEHFRRLGKLIEMELSPYMKAACKELERCCNAQLMPEVRAIFKKMEDDQKLAKAILGPVMEGAATVERAFRGLDSSPALIARDTFSDNLKAQMESVTECLPPYALDDATELRQPRVGFRQHY